MRRLMRGAAAALLLAAPLAFPAAAGPLTRDLTEAEAATLPRVISALEIDLIAGAPGAERVMLLAGAEPDAQMAHLVVFAGSLADNRGAPLLLVGDLAYAGGMAGQSPRLEAAPNGSLQVHSEQIAIGREPWTMTLTLAERDGAVLVAGFTFATWDRITAGSALCDWNLLSGRWEMSFDRAPDPERGIAAETGHATGRDARRMTALEWAGLGDPVPAFCRHDFGD